MRVAISVTDVHGICQLKYGTVYCGSKKWNKKVAAAWNGAEAHPSRADRNPVIFPTAISKVFKNRVHVVYVIHYKPNDRNTRDWVWKFGQTGGATWQDRANESRRICEKSKKSGGKCTLEAVGGTDKEYCNVRFLDASIICDYARGRNDKCPPGQETSCR